MNDPYTKLINDHRDKLWDIARKQTKTNSKCQTAISHGDYEFDDDVWDEYDYCKNNQAIK